MSHAAIVVAAAIAACTPSTGQNPTMPKTPAPATASKTDNPFFTPSPLAYGTPPFDRITDEHYLPAFEEGMRQHAAEVRTIADSKQPPTFANTIEALERSGALLTRVSKVFFNLTESNTNPKIQAIQSTVAPLLAAHQDTIYLDAPLFARIRAIHDARAELTEPEQQRLIERYHTNFVRNGALLGPADQARLRKINEEQSTLTTKFQERLLADTKALAVLVENKDQLRGLDDSAISAAADAAAAAGKPGKFLLPLQLPSSQGVLSSLQDRATRQRVYEASLSRCDRGNENDTKELVLRLAALRAERAQLLGYPNHAAYVLADQMAGTPAAVNKMLTGMAPAIVQKANTEAAELQTWLDQNEPGTRLAPWDWSFVAEQVRKQRYDFDEAEVKQYFELDSVLQNGVFFMARQMYGIELHERKDLPVYHPDVRVFEVFDGATGNGDGSSIGLFYADYYARPEKRGGAWMDNFVDQSGLLGQKPVVVNVLSIGKPSAGQPTLVTFDEVTTLFHEFGHGVHGLFSKVRYPMISGTSVPRDFVEFPSQFHEDFAFDPAVLGRCARHWQTGAPMPKELIEKVRRARTFGQGFGSLEYIEAALLDMAWHSLPAGTEVKDVDAFEAEALRKAGVAHALVPPRYRTTYFSHVWPGGYSAGYYAYLWSEALAADAFAAVMERGGMTGENGAAFRDAVLSRGLTREPMQMFAAFRGRELDTQALLRRRGLL
ncbi:MAG: M3 family metallopeptidase [Planctomycetes bacterium]|nr:M3 family metallopeptidase [Planctomycetota bacterium]